MMRKRVLVPLIALLLLGVAALLFRAPTARPSRNGTPDRPDSGTQESDLPQHISKPEHGTSNNGDHASPVKDSRISLQVYGPAGQPLADGMVFILGSDATPTRVQNGAVELECGHGEVRIIVVPRDGSLSIGYADVNASKSQVASASVILGEAKTARLALRDSLGQPIGGAEVEVVVTLPPPSWYRSDTPAPIYVYDGTRSALYRTRLEKDPKFRDQCESMVPTITAFPDRIILELKSSTAGTVDMPHLPTGSVQVRITRQGGKSSEYTVVPGTTGDLVIPDK